MDVHNRLTSVPPDIHPDVVSRWLQSAIDPLAHGSYELKYVADLGRREIEDVGDMSTRDDQAVARRDGISVENDERTSICLQHPVGRHRAERAGITL